MHVWRLMTHHNVPDEALSVYLNRGFIALGWGAIGDLRTLRPAGPKDISSAIASVVEYQRVRNAGHGGRCLWAFLHEMSRGDLVILSAKGDRSQVVEITGDYEFVPTEDPVIREYQHRRSCRPTANNGQLLWAQAGGAAPSWSTRWPLLLCASSL